MSSPIHLISLPTTYVVEKATSSELEINQCNIRRLVLMCKILDTSSSDCEDYCSLLLEMQNVLPPFSG